MLNVGRSCLLILLGLLGLNEATMDLCEYFARLGLDRPECRQQIYFHPTEFELYDGLKKETTRKVLTFHRLPKTKRLGKTATAVQVVDAPRLPIQRFEVIGKQGFDYPLCRNFYHSCMSSGKCESGTVCTSGYDQSPCCTSAVTKCPSIEEIGINCRKPKSTNWCHTDLDCRGGGAPYGLLSQDICCPTGCNYNICWHQVDTSATTPQPPVIPLLADNLGSIPALAPINTYYHLHNHLVFSRLLNQDQCPDPWKIDVTCTVRRPTSWCAKHTDCPNNSVNPRRCCQTLCGYTACLVKYNNKWMIA